MLRKTILISALITTTLLGYVSCNSLNSKHEVTITKVSKTP